MLRLAVFESMPCIFPRERNRRLRCIDLLGMGLGLYEDGMAHLAGPISVLRSEGGLISVACGTVSEHRE